MLELKLLQLFWLLVAHYIGDFALQQGWMADQKYKDPWVFIAHCFIWTGVICLALQAFGIFAVWKLLFLFIGHFLCDFFKHYAYGHINFHLKNAIDQGFHLLQILIVWLI